jgi:hypothetical protein
MPRYEEHMAHWQRVFTLVRPVGHAQWQPVTGAYTDMPGIVIERFDAQTYRLFTVYRQEASPGDIVVHIDRAALAGFQKTGLELITREPIAARQAERHFEITIPLPEDASGLAVVRFRKQ